MEDELERRARERVGATLRGKYRLQRLIGVGGMASVYAAEHRNGRRVALKLLHPELSLNSEIRDRFLREGHAANRVGHPGAVAVLDDDIAEDGSAFLVMELLDGMSLEDLAERNGQRLPLSVLSAIALDVLDVLDAAHRNGIIHRDIKPANLFFTTEGRVKILDFGIARLLEPGRAGATQTGMMLGTPAFMAPEQALGRAQDIDVRTDLWAVGATLFALASGRCVHEGETAQETLIRAATSPAKSLSAVCAEAPADLVASIDRVLAFDPSARFQSAAAMREVFRTMSSTEPSRETLLSLLQRHRPQHSGDSSMGNTTLPSANWSAIAAADSVSTGAKSGGKQRLILALAGALVLLGLVGTSAVWVLRSFRARAPNMMSASAQLNAAAPPLTTSRSAEPTNLQVTPSAPPPVASSAISRPSATPPRAVSDSPQLARPKPIAPAPTPATSVVVGPAVTPSRLPVPPRAPATNCNPPYWVDSSGTKKWKRECL